MPELPEVETIKRRLSPLVIGKKFTNIKVFRDKSFRGKADLIIGQQIIDLNRRAKILQFKFANDLNMLVHLKMTGQLIYVSEKERVGGGHPTADWIADLPVKHTRIILDMPGSSKLYFNDMRVFGWLWVMTNQEVKQEFAKYGPDINNQDLTIDYLEQQFKRRSISIKQAIMTNKIVAGVGNIYANEALFLAKIDPRRSAKDLTRQEITRLYNYLIKVIEKSIDLGGTTFDGKYVDVAGFAGGYQNKLQVYGQEGEPCPICGQEIKRIKTAGRSTFFCENCQQ